jgi:lambda family phage portal protein
MGDNIRNLDLRPVAWTRVEGEWVRKGGLERTAGLERAATYAAAKTTRQTGAWLTPGGSVKDIISASLPTMRERMRQLVRDFPYIARAIKTETDYIVGSGIRFQSRDPNRKEIESVFNRWAETADYTGYMHLYDMQRLTKRQDRVCGEFLMVRHFEGPYIPLSYQIIEPDFLTDNDTRPFRKSSLIQDGIEYNPKTGRVVGYHFQDPYGYGDTWRAPVSAVVHRFEMLDPGQIRGVMQLAPAIILADSLRELLTNELDASKMAAKWLGMITTEDPGDFQANLEQNKYGDKLEQIENMIFEYLRPGEKMDLNSANRPSTTFDPFTKLIIRMLSIVSGLPYEILSGDYAGLNYSVARIKRNDFEIELQPSIDRHIRAFCDPIAADFYRMASLSGRLSLPGYFADPYKYITTTKWQPTGVPLMDPLKEGKANVVAVDALQKSDIEIAAARGRDYEDVLDEIVLGNEMQEERGLTKTEVSTASQGNPAAVEEQKSLRKISHEHGEALADIIDILDNILNT